MKVNLVCYVSDLDAYVRYNDIVSDAVKRLEEREGFAINLVGALPKISIANGVEGARFILQTEDAQYNADSALVLKELPQYGLLAIAENKRLIANLEVLLRKVSSSRFSIDWLEEVCPCEEWL